jgi:2-polyprenyl-6-methoxyphenol hydroxylase-like FAD-dependent oxidoreductase
VRNLPPHLPHPFPSLPSPSHPSPPTDRGQGLNNAINDAAQLIQQLRDIDHTSPSAIAAAVTRYDEEVQQRGKKAVLSSLENSMMVHDWDRLKESAVFTRGMQKDTKA